MSFHINSDKEKIRGVNPKLIGDNEATIRIGTGADEKEVLRTELILLRNYPVSVLTELDKELTILSYKQQVLDTL